MAGLFTQSVKSALGLIWQGERLQFERYPGGFAEAKKAMEGCASPHILSQVLSATLRVRDGLSAHERDGVNFEEISYTWPVLSALLLSAAQNGGTLSVVDFGGSLGTTFFQNRLYLKRIKRVRWVVVEQENYVGAGRKNFANQELTFETDFFSAVVETRPSVILFGSSLQYVEDPESILMIAKHSGASHIVFDRTPVIAGQPTFLAIQTVPKSIYKARYPSWVFSQNFICDTLGTEWEEFGYSSNPTLQTIKGGGVFSWANMHFVREGN